MLSFKDKYLKYKKKYIQLKQEIIDIQKGSAITPRCSRIDNPLGYPADIVPVYSINQINGYFTRQTVIPPAGSWPNVNLQINPPLPPLPASQVIQPNYVLNSITFNHYVRDIPEPQNPDGLAYAPGNRVGDSTYTLDFTLPAPLGVKTINYFTLQQNLSGSWGPNTVLAGSLDHHNIESSYLSDIIGKNFQLRCEESKVEQLIKSFYGNERNIIVIDFVNIVEKLQELIKVPSNITGSASKNYTKDILKKQINLLIYNYLRKDNLVFIIFKPCKLVDRNDLKEIIYNQKYKLVKYIKNQYSNLQILCVGSSLEHGGSTYVFEGALESSLDDFIFWVVVVFITNLIKKRNNDPNIGVLNNMDLRARLILLTNDKQKLDINLNQYRNNITNVLFANAPRGAQKNLFDLRLGYDFVNYRTNGNETKYSIYLYYLRHTGNTHPNNISNSFIYTNDIMLNRYINFIYNLFGNTPVKLNPRPTGYIEEINRRNVNIQMDNFRNNYVTFQDRIDRYGRYIRDWRGRIMQGPIYDYQGYIYNRNHSVQDIYRNNNRTIGDTLDKIYVYNPHNELHRSLNNIEANVAFWEYFRTNNTCLSQLRTDTIFHIINYYPINGTDNQGNYRNITTYVNTKLNDVAGIYNFNDDYIHPGLCFYAQIKQIQNLIYGDIDGSMDEEQIDNQANIYKNFITVVNDLESLITEFKTDLCQTRNNLNQSLIREQQSQQTIAQLQLQIVQQQQLAQQLQQQLGQVIQERDECLGREYQSQQALVQCQQQLEQLQQQFELLRQQLEQITQERNELVDREQHSQETLVLRQQQLQELQAQLQELQAQLQELQAQFEQVRAERDECLGRERNASGPRDDRKRPAFGEARH